MRYFQYSCIAVICWALAGCKKNELMSFQLHPKVYIYKDSRNTSKDSTIYSFATRPASLMVDTIHIPIRIMGNMMEQNRKVNYSVITNQSDATSSNYELLPANIPAGSFTGTIPVKVMRTEALKTKEFRLWLRIDGTEDLQPGVNNQVTYLVRINDFLSKPASWKDSYFGKYSAVKFALIIRETGYTDFNGIGTSESRFIAQAGKNAVLVWEAEHGTTMLDEFYEPVVFP